jgi:hypothetical protein
MTSRTGAWWVPVSSFLLAAILSFVAGRPPKAFSFRQAQEPTGGCHRPVVIPGDDFQFWNLDGNTVPIALPADCANPGPGIFPQAARFKTVDCRQKKGTFFVSSESIGQIGQASASPEGTSQNNVRKELHLTRTPSTPEECCEKFSGAGHLNLSYGWVITRTGPFLVPGNEGRVLMNDPGHPRRQIVRTEWVDCQGIQRFRERTIVSFFVAEVAWNPVGKTTINKSLLRVAEFFETDQQPQRQLFRTFIAKGTGELGTEAYLMHDDHPDGFDLRDQFRGQQRGDVAASVRITGTMNVVAEAPRGRAPAPAQASNAYGSYHMQVLQHKLKDETENITVPDP